MKNPLLIISVLGSIFLFSFLLYVEFEVDTKQFIKTYLTVSWGLAAVIATNIILMKRATPQDLGDYYASNEKFLIISYLTLLELAIFLFGSILHPICTELATYLSLSSFKLRVIYDSSLMVLLLGSSLQSLFVIGWGFYVTLNSDYFGSN